MTKSKPSKLNKVVFVNRFFYPDHSATSQLLGDLAFDLARTGRTVEVITSRQRYGDASASLPAVEVIDGVKVFRVWTSKFGRSRLAGRLLDYLSFYVSAAVRIILQVNKYTILVVKTDPPLMSLVATPIAKLRGAKTINWLQDLFPEVAQVLGVRFCDGKKILFLKWLRNLSLRASSINIVLGRRMSELVAEAGVSVDRIVVIPNWANGSKILPVSRNKNTLRNRWGLGEKFVVGYSGNLGMAHEYETMLQAMEILRTDGDIVFLFVGGGERRKELEKEVADRRLSSVLFKDYVPTSELSQGLGVADVHMVSLIPELEGMIFPSKFYSVASAGRPIIHIGDTFGDVAYELREFDCGVAVAIGDGELLAETILKLSRDSGLREKMGRNSRASLENNYDLPSALRRWNQVLIYIDNGSVVGSCATGRVL